MNKIDIKLKDFQLCNEWVAETSTPYITDQSTGRQYLLLSCPLFKSEESGIRCVFCFIALGVEPYLTSFFNLVARVFLVVIGHPFWKGRDNETHYNFKERLFEAGFHLAACLATPFTFIALELTALYTIVRPLDGRKVYASIERLAFLYVGHMGLQPINLSYPVEELYSERLLDMLRARRT